MVAAESYVDSSLHHRLVNWARWSRTFPSFTRTSSIEGNYRSPQHWWPEGPKPEQPEANDAWEVCSAMAAIALRYHLTLKLRYIARMDDRGIGRLLRRELREPITTKDVPAIEGMACVLLLESLSAPAVIRRFRARERVNRIINATLDAQRD